MSNEIATYSMILSKLSLGKSETECPTKTQILAINSLIVIENASTYGANECVKIDDIRKKAETWNYYLTVSPTSMSFGAGGGSKSFTVSSYKRKVLDGVEQSGDTSVSLKSTVISGSGFSLSGTTVSASANESTLNRTGTVTITQNESNKTATISLSQSGDTISSYGEWTISVSASPTSVSSSGGTSTITASAKRTVYWASGDVTEETGNPTLSTNLGSLSSSSSPSTLTLGENTSTSSRTATIKATHGGKSATCTVTQAAYSATVEWRYKFGFSGGARDNISIAIRNMEEYDGASVTFASYKSKYVDGVEDVSSRQYVDFSIGDCASWATVTKVSSSIANEGKFRFTLSSNFNNKSNRQTFVTVTQNESNKSIICDIMQVGSDAFVATYYLRVRGSDTYPDEISFGLVTTPTTKQYEWGSTFEVHTVDSDYDAYTYNFGDIIEVKKVTANVSMITTWFDCEYIQDGGSYQYDLLKVNAPESDGINHSEKLYISQLVTSAPSTSHNYREITNTPILAEILVTQKGKFSTYDRQRIVGADISSAPSNQRKGK